MDIEQIKKEQVKLDGIIFNLIRDFEEKTGVCVDRIDLRHEQYIGSRYPFTVSSKTEISL